MVVGDSGDAVAMPFIGGFRRGVPSRVVQHLAHVGERAHQRIGVTVKAAAELKGKRHGIVRTDHHVSRARAAQIDQAPLPWKNSSGGKRQGGSKAGVAPNRDALVVRLQFVGGNSPGSGVGAIFRPHGGVRAIGIRMRGSVTFLGFRQAEIGARIDQTGVDGHAFAIDHPGFRRDIGVGADGLDQALGDDYRAVFNHRARDGEDSGVGDREVGRFASLGVDG